MPVSTLTSKGQITLPKAIRERLRLEAGDRLEFRTDAEGRVFLEPLGLDIREVRGLLRSPRTTPVTTEEMDAAAARGWERRARRARSGRPSDETQE